MRARHRGVTLIEMVVAITVVAIAATTILGALGAAASRSADAMMQQQAIAVAGSYLDEIMQRWVVDPNGSPPNTGRASWDLVDEYNGLVDVGAHDQFGNPIAALSAYTVSVVDLPVERAHRRAGGGHPPHRHHGELRAERQRDRVRLPHELLICALSPRSPAASRSSSSSSRSRSGSIVVAFMALFIVMPMNAYSTQTQQAALVDAADSALRFMARDLRSALPNSVRVTSSGTVTALELLATADGARYQDGGPLSNPALVLDFTAADGAFATTVPFTQLTLPWSFEQLLPVDLQCRRAGRQRLPDGQCHHPGRNHHHHRGGCDRQPESGHVEPGLPIRLRLARQARVLGERSRLVSVRYGGCDTDPLLRLHDCQRAARQRRGVERGRRDGSAGRRQCGELSIHLDRGHRGAQRARHADLEISQNGQSVQLLNEVQVVNAP